MMTQAPWKDSEALHRSCLRSMSALTACCTNTEDNICILKEVGGISNVSPIHRRHDYVRADAADCCSDSTLEAHHFLQPS